jgi:hypothetical protein
VVVPPESTDESHVEVDDERHRVLVAVFAILGAFVIPAIVLLLFFGVVTGFVWWVGPPFAQSR